MEYQSFTFLIPLMFNLCFWDYSIADVKYDAYIIMNDSEHKFAIAICRL